MGVRADCEKRRVTQAHLARVTREQHEPETGYRVNEHKRQLADVKTAQYQGRQQQREHQQAVPGDVRAVLEKADVLLVAGFEDEPHNQTFFCCMVEKIPSGRASNTSSRMT